MAPVSPAFSFRVRVTHPGTSRRRGRWKSRAQR